MLGIIRRWRERRRAPQVVFDIELLKTARVLGRDGVVRVQQLSASAINSGGLSIRAPFRPSRAEIAAIVEQIAEEGLEHPRNLDAAIDALAFSFGVDPNTEMDE